MQYAYDVSADKIAIPGSSLGRAMDPETNGEESEAEDDDDDILFVLMVCIDVAPRSRAMSAMHIFAQDLQVSGLHGVGLLSHKDVLFLQSGWQTLHMGWGGSSIWI
ncbi:hypothetical protein SERLA73DRAFT_156418 [Serpula lacrymans var. lacrymans S7.3]|uniref:Uncharacterized protein n=2 Tax=Serpula lacrymans var. lacrymans TaxID=341189 RepID=F8QED5_SERL3|nr:uncharacterized protein SERLADRAFT_412082 [Serpula lacrymans var. lacrymans S7.9]EGN93510.1 hypothetical protein SERLA73DRAFT_156418 [Serpula lacrymans var. lacrymans S7.3]EGO18890.1 hypothetical protein SERLADRAFT_412082 [Serpula lacrymans var. lacrymans S7.9]